MLAWRVPLTGEETRKSSLYTCLYIHDVYMRLRRRRPDLQCMRVKLALLFVNVRSPFSKAHRSHQKLLFQKCQPLPPKSSSPLSSLVPFCSQDRDGADFFKDVQMMVDQLGTNPVPIQLPIGKAATFKGVYDLVEMRSIIWTGEESVYREVGTLEVIKPYIFTRHIPSVDCLRTTGVRMRKRNIRKIPRHSLRPVFPDFNRFLMM